MINFNKHIKIGVVGAGSMGTGIAQVAAMAGHNTIVADIDKEQLVKSQEKFNSTMSMLLEKEKISQDEYDILRTNIKFTEDINELSKCGLVIEAIVEDLSVKKSLFSKLDEILSIDCILATNTSSLPIVAIASDSRKPSRVIGLHFFNPVPLMKLVEVIPALTTDDKFTQLCFNLMKEWGKQPVIAKDTPGFIVNKVARPFYGEALRIYEEGIADFITIDSAMKNLGKFRMGPFELMDLIGNDVNYKVTESVFEGFYYDSRYKPSITQRRYVEAKWLGRKTNRGFYDYENSACAIPIADPDLQYDIFLRIFSMLVNEASDTLMMNIASRDDIEIAMTSGVNYPKGLFEWANEIGLDKIVACLNKLYEKYNEDRYRVCPLLKRHLSIKKSL